jgi:hypothetical protein
MINNVMAKYADIRKGLFDTHYEISGKPPSANTNSGEEPKQAISLIDLDDDNTGNGQSTGAEQSTNVLNELSDIFGSNVAISSPNNNNNNNHNNTMADIFGSTMTVANSTTNNNDLFDLLGGSQSTSNNSIASPSLHNVNVSPQQAASPVLNQGKIETGKNIYIYIYIIYKHLIFYIQLLWSIRMDYISN